VGYPFRCCFVHLGFKYSWKRRIARFLTTTTFVVKEIAEESTIKTAGENKIIIYYEPGSSMLKPSEIKKLRRFARTCANASVKVIGYTDPVGSFKRNQVVARQRASKVSMWLKQNGVSVSTTRSKPKCCYVSKEKLWKNRRVEIIYEKGGEQ